MANDSPTGSAKGLAAYGYTPRTGTPSQTADAATGKGLADLGYDRTGYISKMSPEEFTAPLSTLATKPTTSSLNSQVAKYAEERLNARNQQIEAQLGKAYNNMDQLQKNLYDDLYSFYGNPDVSRDAFYRQMFDLSGRLSNNAVSKAALGKMADYTSEANFNADAKRTGFFSQSSKDAGLLFGWGAGMEGDSDLYAGSKTFQYREDMRKRTADQQAFNYNRAYLDSYLGAGGQRGELGPTSPVGQAGAAPRQPSAGRPVGNYQKSLADVEPGETYDVVHMGETPEDTVVIGDRPTTRASRAAEARRQEAARRAAEQAANRWGVPGTRYGGTGIYGHGASGGTSRSAASPSQSRSAGESHGPDAF